tara:strand:+ start:269 stop:955 length:687 start_codon:yes stop_codon:yes gene_type:complete
MKFVLEGDLDFASLLKKAVSDNSNQKTCLLTHDVLSDNHITLPCDHSFNYKPLYDEIVMQKRNHNHLETTRLRVNELKCPYCRTIHKKLLPYICCPGVQKVSGVNYPLRYSMKFWDCEWVFKTGKNKGNACPLAAQHTGYGYLCLKHYKSKHKAFVNPIKSNKTTKTSEPIPTTKQKCSNLTPEQLAFYKANTVKSCKEILRANKYPMTGNKEALVKRIFTNNITTHV